MPRLNLRLGNGENVKASLTKVDLKHKRAKLPASWLSQEKPSSLQVSRGFWQGVGGWGEAAGENEREKRAGSK